jgi:hypothetical protein
MSKNLFISDFMNTISDKLKEERNLSDPSVKLYLRQLTTLNDNESFKNLNFLKKVDDILEKLKDYKENTKKSYLSAIEAVLSLFKKNKQSLKLYETYKGLLEEKKKDYNDKDKNEANEKEQDNWLSLEEIKKTKDDLLEGLYEKKSITATDWSKLLRAFLISLYTDLLPRRNQDYLLCFIIKKSKKDDNKDLNYLVLDENKFVFNKYKTSKSAGQQIIEFGNNDSFKRILNLYLKHHPLFKKSKGLIPLLVDSKGVPPTTPNWITKLLNKTFKKKVGSSLLRKIYLTSKYGDQLEKLKEMKEDAKKMGHSTGAQQGIYIKNI